MRAHSKKKNKFAAFKKIKQKEGTAKAKTNNFWAGKLGEKDQGTKEESTKVENFWKKKLGVKVVENKEESKGSFWGGKLPVKAKPIDNSDSSAKTAITPSSEEESSS